MRDTKLLHGYGRSVSSYHPTIFGHAEPQLGPRSSVLVEKKIDFFYIFSVETYKYNIPGSQKNFMHPVFEFHRRSWSGPSVGPRQYKGDS